MIDVSFDFTTDSYKYWDGFWDRKDGLGEGYSDPDSCSPTLQEYHRILWSKTLPNGEHMELKNGKGSKYLTWNDFRFGSDNIIASFRYKKYTYMIEQVKSRVEDFHAYYEGFIHNSYTIGGTIIFPKHLNSINQRKGTIAEISDRWDLTMECIRRFYAGIESPLSCVMECDKEFFDLFMDFKGYVDFFFLQDCVSCDYSKVNFWTDVDLFNEAGLPKTVEEYFRFIEKETEFLKKRNERIHRYCIENNI